MEYTRHLMIAARRARLVLGRFYRRAVKMRFPSYERGVNAGACRTAGVPPALARRRAPEKKNNRAKDAKDAKILALV
jgi:hypothetical protein